MQFCSELNAICEINLRTFALKLQTNRYEMKINVFA